ncbi:MAG: hypothetical protein Q9217_002467 [Psora testacea]
MDLRGKKDVLREELPEEVVWQKHLECERDLERKHERKQKRKEHGNTLSPPKTPLPSSAVSVAKKTTQMKLTIPEFVPSAAGKEMIWSPTSGSRPRRPSDEKSSEGDQLSSFKANLYIRSPSLPAQPRPPPVTSGYGPPQPRSITAFSADPQCTNTGASPLEDITNRQAALHISECSSRQFADRAHYHPLTPIKRDSQSSITPLMKPTLFDTAGDHRTSLSPTRPQSGREPISTRPCNSTFSSPQNTTQRPQPSPSSSHQTYPPHPPYGLQHDHSDAFTNQLDPTTFHPDPLIWGPSLPPATVTATAPPLPPPPPPPSQTAIFQTQTTTSFQNPSDETGLTIPLPGSMDPLAYWNLLYHRESHILSRLAAAGLPLTQEQMRYVTLLQDARVGAAASQLPVRGRKGRKAWLRELEEVYQGIWILKPGQMGWSEEVVARKKDFERALVEEIEMAKMEGRKGRRGDAYEV